MFELAFKFAGGNVDGATYGRAGDARARRFSMRCLKFSIARSMRARARGGVSRLAFGAAATRRVTDDITILRDERDESIASWRSCSPPARVCSG